MGFAHAHFADGGGGEGVRRPLPGGRGGNDENVGEFADLILKRTQEP